jgi:YD repeat-containing protein
LANIRTLANIRRTKTSTGRRRGRRDADGNVVRRTDPDNNATTFVVDKLGRATQTINALGGLLPAAG